MSCEGASRAWFAANHIQQRLPCRGSKKACRGVRSVQVNASCALMGVGSSTPETVVSNDDLSEFVDTNDEWISTRTGIRRRHVLAEGEGMIAHAVSSCERALEMSGVAREDIDMIIMATSSHEDLFGSAGQVQRELGIKQAISFDLTAACSGFVVALITAAQFIQSGSRKNVLVIGADALSRYIDWNDRGTCILFGDGAGAAVLSAREEGPNALLGSDMKSDGEGYCHLKAPVSPDQAGKLQDAEKRSSVTSFENIYMSGQDVYKFAVRAVPNTLKASLADAGLTSSDIDWLVMHQANKRILDAAAKKLGIDSEKVVSNLAEYGNTSAASIPLALSEAVESGQIKDGEVLALAG